MPTATDLVIRRMYESPPDGFVAARSAAIADAKKAGDSDAVKRLTALRKPTVAAWLVNLLALRRPELIDELVELATALRTAQRSLQGEQLRELSDQRRQIVSALVREARRLAVAEDRGMAGKLPLGEVEATLTAALAEPEVAAQVRTGRLIRAATYAGFGEVPRPRLRLVTDEEHVEAADEEEAGESGADESGATEETGEEPARQTARERAAADRRRREHQERRRELKRELTTAQAAETRADEQLERAENAERDAGHAVEDLDAELAELERRRTEAQAEVARRKQARRAAEREAAAARRRVGDAEAALDDLEAGGAD
jgi:chromosome segregation ATPase